MKKFTRQLLTGVVALGLLTPVAASSINSPKITVNASRWHRGTPRHIRGWYKQKRGHYRFTVFCDDGLAGTYLMHYYHHKWHVGNFEERHASYKYLSHGKYRVSTRGNKFTIRKHGSHVSVWWHGFHFGNCHSFTF